MMRLAGFHKLFQNGKVSGENTCPCHGKRGQGVLAALFALIEGTTQAQKISSGFWTQLDSEELESGYITLSQQLE